MTIQSKIYTADDLWEIAQYPENDGKRLELINGVIVEMSPSERHGLIAAFITIEIGIYLRKHNIGRVSVESAYRMPGDEHNARLPDVAFTSHERAAPVVEEGYVPQMPDLAVEVASPSNTLQELREKAEYYLQNGAQTVWVVHPGKQTVDIYTASGDGVSVQTLKSGDTLDGADVLPGFALAVGAIFAD